MAILKAEGVWKEYRLGPGNVVQALRGLDFELEQGAMAAVTGPSGSGKSTFLHVLGCLDTPTRGHVWIDGKEASSLSPNELARLRRDKLGFVFQQYHLIPTLTALENVMLPLRYARVPRGQGRERAQAELDRVGLGRRMGHRPAQLSGGEQQRVAIARALINNPAVVFADEPTGELDSATSNEIVSLLKQLNSEAGVTLLIVTHNPEVAAACSSQVRMLDGRLDG